MVLRCQFVTSNEKGGTRYLPYVFTGQGVAMLSAILRSPKAITVSIRIMEAFVAMRRFMISNEAMFQRVQSLEIRQWRTNEKVDSILNRLDKRREGVAATIYTQRISNSLQTDINLHNEQYSPINVHIISNAHDRFLVIDDIVYHIGASIKDLGKKIFAFSRMNENPENLLSRLI